MKRIGIAMALVLLVTSSIGVGAGASNASSGASGETIPCFALEDSYEDNDTFETAAAVTLPLTSVSLRICPDDGDYYKFIGQPLQTIEADVTYSTANGNVRLFLYQEDVGSLGVVSQSLTDSGVEHVSWAVGSSSHTYYVYVFLGADPGTEGAPYSLSISQTTPAQKPTGDVNDDGSINAIDAALILQYSAGLTHSLQNAPSADTNGNGSVDSIDAALILQYAAGLVTHFPG